MGQYSDPTQFALSPEKVEAKVRQIGADNSDNVKEIPAMPTTNSATNQIPANIRNLEIVDKVVEVSEKNGVVHFGSFQAPRRARLNDHGAIYGFLNALAGIKTEAYPILKRGAHFKYDWETLKYMYDMPSSDMFVGYACFDMLEDADVIAQLKKLHIEPREDSMERWLALRVKAGKMFIHHAVTPMSMETMKEVYAADKAEAVAAGKREPLFDTYRRNLDRDWAIFNKHQGIELAMMLLDGTMQVSLLNVFDKEGFEYLADLRQVRFEALFGSKDTLQSIIMTGIQVGREHTATAIVAGNLRNNPANMQTVAAKIATQGITVVLNGERREVEATFLVGKTVAPRVGETVRPGRFFLKDLATVFAVQAHARELEGVLEIM